MDLTSVSSNIILEFQYEGVYGEGELPDDVQPLRNNWIIFFSFKTSLIDIKMISDCVVKCWYRKPNFLRKMSQGLKRNCCNDYGDENNELSGLV